MILDCFVAGFRSRFPEIPLTVHDSDKIAIIQGDRSPVGNIEVQDDIDELTVTVGDFTHGHFGCYEEHFSVDERREWVVESVLDFLANVFANKVEFYGSHSGGGGWRPAGSG